MHRGKGCAGECKQELAGLRREVRVLKCEARYYRAMHGKAVAREQRLKETLSAVRTKLKELRQRLRERQARRSNKSEQSEQRGQRATSGGSAAPAPRPRGQQPGSSGHGRRDHSALPAQVEHHELEPNARCCPKCGAEYHAAGSEDSEVLEIEVRAPPASDQAPAVPLQLRLRRRAAGGHRAGAVTADSEGDFGGSRSGCRCCSTSIAITDRPIGCWKT